MRFVTAALPIAIVLFHCVKSNPVKQANDYLDNVLGRFLQNERKSEALEDIPVANFNITVKSNFISNRDLKAKFTNGKVMGLSKIYREGDCMPTRWQSGNITLECKVNLSPVLVAYAGFVKGHTLTGGEEQMDFFVRIRSSTADFHAVSAPNRPAVIRTFVINEPLRLTAHQSLIGPQLQLNKGREIEFYDKFQQVAERHLRNALATNFVRAINRILEANKDVLLLPPVS